MALGSLCCRLALALVALLPALPLAAADQPVEALVVEAERLDGSPYSLADHKGEITLISVWSPESLSSRKSIWELQRFAVSYASRGVYTLAALVVRAVLNDTVAARTTAAVTHRYSIGEILMSAIPRSFWAGYSEADDVAVVIEDGNEQLKSLLETAIREQLQPTEDDHRNDIQAGLFGAYSKTYTRTYTEHDKFSKMYDKS